MCGSCCCDRLDRDLIPEPNVMTRLRFTCIALVLFGCSSPQEPGPHVLVSLRGPETAGVGDTIAFTLTVLNPQEREFSQPIAACPVLYLEARSPNGDLLPGPDVCTGLPTFVLGPQENRTWTETWIARDANGPLPPGTYALRLLVRTATEFRSDTKSLTLTAAP